MKIESCRRNFAHNFLYDFEDSLFNCLDKGRKLKEKTKVKRALRYLELSGESPLVQHLIERKSKYLVWCKNESLDCINFLIRAWSSMEFASTCPEFCIDNFWSAYAMTSVELLKKAIDENRKLPEEISFKRISDVFFQNVDWKLRSNILDGLRKVIENINDYERWQEYNRALGEGTIDSIFSCCYEGFKKLRTFRGTNIAKCVADLIGLWNNLATLHAKELTKNTQADKRELLETFSKEIANNGMRTIELLEIFLKTRTVSRNYFFTESFKFKDCIQRFAKIGHIDQVQQFLTRVSSLVNDIRNRNASNKSIQQYFGEIQVIIDGLSHNVEAIIQKEPNRDLGSTVNDFMSDPIERKNMSDKSKIELKFDHNKGIINFNFDGTQHNIFHDSPKNDVLNPIIEVVRCMASGHQVDFLSLRHISEEIEKRGDISPEDIANGIVANLKEEAPEHLDKNMLQNIIDQLLVSASGSLLAKGIILGLQLLLGLSPS